MELVWFLAIGGVAGWLAGKFSKGSGFGVLRNIIVGIVGGMLGGWLFGVLGIGGDDSLIGSLVTAFVGAVVLLFLIGIVTKKKP